MIKQHLGESIFDKIVHKLRQRNSSTYWWVLKSNCTSLDTSGILWERAMRCWNGCHLEWPSERMLLTVGNISHKKGANLAANVASQGKNWTLFTSCRPLDVWVIISYAVTTSTVVFVVCFSCHRQTKPEHSLSCKSLCCVRNLTLTKLRKIGCHV